LFLLTCIWQSESAALHSPKPLPNTIFHIVYAHISQFRIIHNPIYPLLYLSAFSSPPSIYIHKQQYSYYWLWNVTFHNMFKRSQFGLSRRIHNWNDVYTLLFIVYLLGMLILYSISNSYLAKKSRLLPRLYFVLFVCPLLNEYSISYQNKNSFDFIYLTYTKWQYT